MRSEKGFTITELLVAVAISSIASVLMVTAFVFIYGSVIREQVKTSMVRESQLFLSRVVEDIRVAGEMRTTNIQDDPSELGTASEWMTSDPANILITTQPATDGSRNIIYDTASGFPYYHEIIYFKEEGKMYRRTLENPLAVGSTQKTTCTIGTPTCNKDIELLSNVENMLFQFYDIDDLVTAVPENARSVQITINLRKQVYGQSITTTNTTRITLRNEN